MLTLFASRIDIKPEDHVVRYRGSAGALQEYLLLGVLSNMVVKKPLVEWLPSGGVLRDRAKACSWAKWYCGYQHNQYRDSHHDNFRLVLFVITDAQSAALNLTFRLEPINGEGSVSYCAYVIRTGEDQYACFEY